LSRRIQLPSKLSWPDVRLFACHDPPPPLAWYSTRRTADYFARQDKTKQFKYRSDYLMYHSNASRKWHLYIALVIRRTVLYDLSVLAIRRTVQINSRPTEIMIYIWKQSVDLRGWWVWLVRIKLSTRVSVMVRGFGLGLWLGL